ncbi:GNAT family N-acetyltransferase [Cohnella herbarum]|uniref:GNAT family N-acetyltransferase n=1 Tax=Cohnella herbarum TaxID=2728023 RepID=A0A7Z2VI15_9BACL|nr:GNAT family N-acetyltransferase [Cohnella herbarum]QJD83249.1 GNAT family N-acetyltransferase [Cohnella herbarum]
MTITFEFLNEKHLQQITEWHKEPETLYRVSIEDTDTWFKSVSSNLDYFVWVAIEDNELVGEVIVELIDYKKAVIAFIVNPKLRKQGYGKKLIRCLLDYRYLKEINEFEAWVDDDNVGSIKCVEAVGFLKATFQIDDDQIKYVYKRRKQD